MDLRILSVSEIFPDPNQPREEFDQDELERLASSLEQHGVLQPVTVRRVEDRWLIVAGERRWRAAQIAGLDTLPCSVIDPEEDNVLVLQLVENSLRKDLTPLEQARAIQRLMDSTGENAQETARRLSIHSSTVCRALQLLELPEPTILKLERGEVTMTAALQEAHGHASRPSQTARATSGGGRPPKAMVLDYEIGNCKVHLTFTGRRRRVTDADAMRVLSQLCKELGQPEEKAVA